MLWQTSHPLARLQSATPLSHASLNLWMLSRTWFFQTCLIWGTGVWGKRSSSPGVTMSSIILAHCSCPRKPFHGGGCANATRWSAIRRNVVTVPANLPRHCRRRPDATKGRSPVLRGPSGGRGGKVYREHTASEKESGTGAVIPNQIALKWTARMAAVVFPGLITFHCSL